MTTEVEKSAGKARENARRIEQARACKPLIDPIAALKRSLSGGNHGTAETYGAEALPAPTLGEKMIKAVEAGAARFRAENAPPAKRLSQEDRKRAAEGLRESADRVERGF